MNGEEEKSPLSNGGSVHSESKYNRIHLTPVNNDGEQGSGQKNDAKGTTLTNFGLIAYSDHLISHL